MKFSIFSSFILVFVFLLTSFAPSTEFIYTSIEGKFSITFPASYKSASKKTEKYTTIKTQASLEDQLYFVSYSVHNMKIEEHESFAATSLESFNKSLGGSIRNQASWSVNDHNGLQAVIDIPTKNLKVAYRTILIDQIQYQIVVISESTKWNQENADEFIASFIVEE